MTAQHGILKPNPVLFDLEKRKKKPVLAHELGAGAPCQVCGDKCPGFQLHFWRKHCCNCHCGKIEHDVIEDVDPGFYFVGRIFDLPLRSKKEELTFCYGSNSSSDEDEERGSREKVDRKRSNNNNNDTIGGISKTSTPGVKKSNKKNVKFDWIPPNVSENLARRYLKELPSNVLPVAGSDGAKQRQRNLEQQFPVHDVDPDQCHELTATELESMREFVAFVKENVAGQGIIQVVTPPKIATTKQILGNLDDPDWFPPPPPELMLDPPSPTTSRQRKPDTVHHGPNGTFRAVPYTPSETGSGRTSPYLPPKRHVGFLDDSDISLQKANISESRPGLKCQNCREPIEPGQIAIRAERAGPKMMWHPRCFSCQACKELLVDLLYYYDEGGIYCARDYAERKSIPRCQACDELIFCAEYTGAEESFWHLKHFCCLGCDQPLAGLKYISVEGDPHCLTCFQTRHGKVCFSCGEYISPEDQRVSIDEKTHWHAKPECFQCNVCHSSLIGKKLAKKFGLILCSSECAKKAAETLPKPNTSSPNTSFLSTDF